MGAIIGIPWLIWFMNKKINRLEKCNVKNEKILSDAEGLKKTESSTQHGQLTRY